MSIRSAVQRIAFVLVLLFALSVVAGSLLGQPMGVAYVETGSMAPTLEAGDGFIAVPTPLAGDISEGDIVVFEAVNLNDGGVVTHRVVDETQRGYITRGDANVVTDQDGAEPPVTDAQIKAKVLAIGDWVVVIPNLGTAILGGSAIVQTLQEEVAALLGTRAVLGTRGLSYLLLGFGGMTYVLSVVAEQSGKQRSRSTRRSADAISATMVIAVMTTILILLLSASMLGPGGVYQIQFVSAETDAAGYDVIKQNTTETVEYTVPNDGVLPVVAVIEPATDDIAVNESTLYIQRRASDAVTLRVHAPPETGVHTEAVTEHRYLAILPVSVLLELHAIHEWAPIIVINVVVSSLFIGVAVALIGLDPIRIRRQNRGIPLRIRIRRWFE